MPSAPIVMRYGHLVLHCNDPSLLGSVMEQLAAISLPSAADMTTQMLTSHEKLLDVGRRHNMRSIGELTARLARTGHSALSKRVRSAARARGAHAHPDVALPEEVAATLAADDADASAVRQWRPEMLADDRELRRRGRALGRSQAVQRPSDAAPTGGSCQEPAPQVVPAPQAMEARLSLIEKQIDMLLAGQVGFLEHVRVVADRRHETLLKEVRALHLCDDGLLARIVLSEEQLRDRGFSRS